eukprot:12831510-Heterocapsa_arctica.AAC.1
MKVSPRSPLCAAGWVLSSSIRGRSRIASCMAVAAPPGVGLASCMFEPLLGGRSVVRWGVSWQKG